MKTVVKEHNIKTGETILNSDFMVFARDVGFTPIACRPYRPQTKDSVENVAKIMDRLKVYNNEIETFEDIIDKVVELNKSLNNELSQATKEKPLDLFLKEKEYLLKISNNDLLEHYRSLQTRKVSNESMIIYSGSKYSVPTIYIGKIVEIDIEDQNLLIYYSKKLITCHTITDNIYNYHKEDLIDIMKSEVYKNKSIEELDKLADERLKSYSNLGKRG